MDVDKMKAGRDRKIRYKNFKKYMDGYGVQAVLAPLFKMVEALLELFVPIVMKNIIDFGIVSGSIHVVYRDCGLLILLGILGLAFSLLAQFFAANASVGYATALRSDMFRHINSMSYPDIDEAGAGTLITRITSDVNQVQSGLNMGLRLLMRSPFIVFGSMIMAFTIDFKAALIFAVTIPLLFIVAFGIILITLPMYRKIQGRLEKVLVRTRENITGVRVIRAFANEGNEKAQFTQENDALRDMQVFAGRISTLLNPLTYVMVNAATMALLWTGAVRTDAGDLTQGEVVALVNYMTTMLVELIKFANLIITVTKAVACSQRVARVVEVDETEPFKEEYKEEITNGTDKETADGRQEVSQKETSDKRQSSAYVEFNNVSFKYAHAAQPSLEGISFKVRKGETVGIIGGTGSGKSTLVNLIPYFYNATDGKVTVNGEILGQMGMPEIKKLRSKIGIVPQSARLFNQTVRENLKFGCSDADDEDIWKALDVAQASDFVKNKKEGLDLMLTEGTHNLSGGQKQRLTIARALVRKPDILILDDSASALDFATDYKLRQSIRALSKELTVFIVSQRVSAVRESDFIVVLDDGSVAGIGTHEDLIKKCDVYKEICASQQAL
jgi:ATP-binding cassette, subfamily B, multidrug efflux pump